MSSSLHYQLDNPAWFALNGPQQSFAEPHNYVKRYRVNNLPFAAYNHDHPDQLHLLDAQLQPGEIFFLIGAIPALPHK